MRVREEGGNIGRDNKRERRRREYRTKEGRKE